MCSFQTIKFTHFQYYYLKNCLQGLNVQYKLLLVVSQSMKIFGTLYSFSFEYNIHSNSTVKRGTRLRAKHI